VFWPDDISLVGDARVDPALILTSGQVTDTYLLALAAVQRGQLATLVHRISAKAVKGGAVALHLIDTI
jgi:hypothetical protein